MSRLYDWDYRQCTVGSCDRHATYRCDHPINGWTNCNKALCNAHAVPCGGHGAGERQKCPDHVLRPSDAHQGDLPL